MPEYGCVQGTWGFSLKSAGMFWQPGSNFNCYMTSKGFELLKPEDPFIWNTNLNGLNPFETREKNHKDWMAGAHAWKWWLADIIRQRRKFILHSHAFQLFQYYLDMSPDHYIDTWIAVGSPIRGDMMPIIERNRYKYRQGLLITDTHVDWTKYWGEAFAGNRPPEEKLPFKIDKFPGPQHSYVLNNPDFFHLWEERGWLELLMS